MARTMTDERERELRTVYVEGPYEDKTSHAETWAELDAERDAHEETLRDAKLDHVTLTNRVQLRDDEIAALKARLKLAEAVCELMEARDLRMNDALAAWRAGK